MTFPDPTAATCRAPACARPNAAGSGRCREHLAEMLRERGEHVPFANPVLAALAPVVIFALTATKVDRYRDPRAPSAVLDLWVLADEASDWQFGQAALDILGAQLTDIFGATRLEAPTADPPDVFLRLRVGVPESNVGRIQLALSAALIIIMDEFIGAGRYQGAVDVSEEDPR